MIKMAIAYDFDGTLAKGNIQENSFLPNLGIRKDDFWKKVKKEAQDNNMSEILAYMRLIIQEADNKNEKITYEVLKKHGSNVNFFNGVEDYFDRINEYAKEHGIEIEHYIISSGTKKMIEGTKIASKFKVIFASSFTFNAYGKPEWPAVAIDYTSKTQYLYRISKGILNAWDSQINKTIPIRQRSIRFENMIYIGDGETDIPAMALLKSKKGTSIVVYDDKNSEKEKQAKDMLENNKADYAVPLDYSENKPLDKIIKMIINKVALSAKYGKYQNDTFQKIEKNPQEKDLPTTKQVEDYLEILKIKTFSTNKDQTNCIYLEEDNWDDNEYKTTFRMYKKLPSHMAIIGRVKIGFIGQNKEKHTIKFLDKNFTNLRETLGEKNFISYFKVTDLCLTDEEKEALSFLLNDIRDTDSYDNEDIVKFSIKRGLPF